MTALPEPLTHGAGPPENYPETRSPSVIKAKPEPTRVPLLPRVPALDHHAREAQRLRVGRRPAPRRDGLDVPRMQHRRGDVMALRG